MLLDLERSLDALLHRLDFPLGTTLDFSGALRIASDILLPSLVYFYYENSDSPEISFFQYIDSLSCSDVKSKMPVPYRFLKEFFNQTELESKKLDIDISKLSLRGDLHAAGANKYIIEGKEVVYSQYPNYYDLVKSLKGLVPDSFFYAIPKHRKRGSVTTREFVDSHLTANSKKEIEEYYFRLGETIPALLILRVIDLYSENMVVSLPNPVFFDMECLFTPTILQGSYNVRQTGMLRVGQEDLSTFSGGGMINSYLRPHLSGDPFQPKIQWIVPFEWGTENIPLLNGVKVNPFDYKLFLLDGYAKGSSLIKSNLDKIIRVVKSSNIVVRVLPRRSAIYKGLIQKYLFPNIYLENVDPMEFFRTELEKKEMMHNFKDIEGLISYEARCLSNGFIPVLYNEIHDVDAIDPFGSLVTELPQESYKVWLNYISNSSLLDEQLTLLKQELSN